jgi:hypothetical protein
LEEGEFVEEEREYLVPDYYDHFSCKMGECRAACCEGWPISISLEDYYHLMSEECSPELRQKLEYAAPSQNPFK